MALAPDGQGFEQDCSQCHDPEKRKKWGCDEPCSESIANLVPCPFCNTGVQGCEHCGGENTVPIFRCPRKLVTAREVDALQAAAMVEVGVLPDPGGWQDQAYTFVRAYPIAMREINDWRQKRRDIAAQKAAAASKGKR